MTTKDSDLVSRPLFGDDHRIPLRALLTVLALCLIGRGCDGLLGRSPRFRATAVLRPSRPIPVCLPPLGREAGTCAERVELDDVPKASRPCRWAGGGWCVGAGSEAAREGEGEEEELGVRGMTERICGSDLVLQFSSV